MKGIGADENVWGMKIESNENPNKNSTSSSVEVEINLAENNIK